MQPQMRSSITSSKSGASSAARSALRAFTLVELLVVIGIIALLISILLPVMNKVREQGLAVKCQSNLRTVYMGLAAYAAEQKGSLPWGFIWERVQGGRAEQASGAAARHSNWASLIQRYLTVKRAEVGMAGNYSQSRYFDAYSEVLRCPSVDAGFEQYLTYGSLSTAMPNYYEENDAYLKNPASNPPPLKPAKFSDLYSDNTLLWDGPAWTKLKKENPGEYIAGNTIHGGYGNTAYTFIDAGQLLAGNPQDYRHRDKGPDPYAGVDPQLDQNFPIVIPSRKSYVNSNTDVTTISIQNGQCNTPRFRHNREKVCNAVLADGSVRSFSIKDINKGGGKYFNDENIVESDWLRRFIMIKYP